MLDSRKPPVNLNLSLICSEFRTGFITIFIPSLQQLDENFLLSW